MPDAGAPGGWRADPEVKAAILARFRDRATTTWDLGGALAFRDRVGLPTKRLLDGPEATAALEAGRPWRIVPGGTSVRAGVYLAPGVVVMPPSFVNVGAWIGEDTMVDSHVLVGSCAQIGARVHLSAGVTIGGVLEPAGARPVIVEDGAFVGAGSRLLEGVLVGAGAVIGAGVVLTGTSRLYDLVRGPGASRARPRRRSRSRPTPSWSRAPRRRRAVRAGTTGCRSPWRCWSRTATPAPMPASRSRMRCDEHGQGAGTAARPPVGAGRPPRPPARAQRDPRAGRLGGLDPAELAGRFGTPFYAYDLDVVSRQVEALARALPPCFDLAYAVKANPNLAVLRHLAGPRPRRRRGVGRASSGTPSGRASPRTGSWSRDPASGTRSSRRPSRPACGS